MSTADPRRAAGRGPHNAHVLTGLRVLELGGGVPANVCTKMFAELGADVLKVEPPSGDPLRADGPFRGGDPSRPGAPGGEFLALNLNKRSTVLNLKEPAGKATLWRLIGQADLVVLNAHPADIDRQGLSPDAVRDANPGAVCAYITPFGLSGPRRNWKGNDLVAFHASGVARRLIGQVDDLEARPPVRAAGRQAEFIAGIVAACASMHGVLLSERTGEGCVIDVSMQEAMACNIVTELALPAFGEPAQPRTRTADGGGATVAILPTRDGHVAISPREEHQWRAWLGVMGHPPWADDERFATKRARVANWDQLFPRLCEWSKQRAAREICEAAESARVPCFPLGTPADMLASAQLRHRRFFRDVAHPGYGALRFPGNPYGLEAGSVPVPVPAPALGNRDRPNGNGWLSGQRRHTAGAQGTSESRRTGSLPLSGVRVVDFSWVIAGPTCTRYLAAMGAEVIKVESASRPDPGRKSRLHDVLGQSKLSLSLNLKSAGGNRVARRLIARSDVVVENFGTGVMERLGLGYDALRELRPGLVMLSASGMGRTGPDSRKAAYGTLLQCYTGFSALNGFPGDPPRVGMAWVDPMCGLAMAFAVAAALYERKRTGEGKRIDFSMVEATLATMPGPLLDYQMNGAIAMPNGNRDRRFAPHGAYRCAGDDAWVAVAVTSDEEWQALCGLTGAPGDWRGWDENARRTRHADIDERITSWTRARDPASAAEQLQAAGVPAAASMSGEDLTRDPHLAARGFFAEVEERDGTPRRLPGLPWRWVAASRPRHTAAPSLGEHARQVLTGILGLADEDVDRLQAEGALD